MNNGQYNYFIFVMQAPLAEHISSIIVNYEIWSGDEVVLLTTLSARPKFSIIHYPFSITKRELKIFFWFKSSHTFSVAFDDFLEVSFIPYPNLALAVKRAVNYELL